MRSVRFYVLVLLLLPVHIALGQEDVKPEQLKTMYDSAMSQLKDAQDRKNELAQENEKLKATLEDLKKQLETAKAAEATFADRTYQWRSTYAAWQLFLQRFPVLAGQWEAFLKADLFAPTMATFDAMAPDGAAPATATSAPTTQAAAK